jgi:hypothetical protein
MALLSAGFEVGGMLGSGGVGLALAVHGDYPAVYRLLGLVPLATLGLLAITGRRSPRPIANPVPVDRPIGRPRSEAAASTGD